jgi:hypothetical protein
MSHMKTSIAELTNKPWTISITYSGDVDQNYVAEWKSFHSGAPTGSAWSRQVPFWTGTVNATVTHQPTLNKSPR